MNCQEFTAQLPDYLDETLDADVRAEAHRHLAACRECQFALRRSEALLRSLQGALERETAHLALAPETQQTILAAARTMRSAPAEVAAGRSAWRWLLGHPRRALAAVAAVAALLFVAGQLQRQRSDRAEHRRARSTWSIEVPFQSGSQVGVIHADFSEP